MTDFAQRGDRPPPPRPPSRSAGSAEPGSGSPRGELAGGTWRLVAMAAVTAVLGVLLGLGVIVVVLAIAVMITLHELGHFLTAKWSGMKVTEFFVGFGPRLWSTRRGETEYGLKLIPAGAYVRIIGMNNLDEVDPADEPRTYRQQSFPKRLLVASAGSGMHFLQALVLFFVVFAVLGAPGGTLFAERLGGRGLDLSDWSVGGVQPGSAADRAGLDDGDRIRAIDGHRIEAFTEIGPLIADRAGDTVALVVERDGRELTLDATLGHRPDDREAGYLGVGAAFASPAVRGNPVESAVLAGRETIGGIGLTIEGLGRFFTGGVGDFADQVIHANDAGSPAVEGSSGGGSSAPSSATVDDGSDNRVISIFGAGRIGADLFETDLAGFLLFLALLNLSIGVLNLIPLLPLDGGHVVVAVYERVRSRRGGHYMADVSKLMPVAYATVLILVLLGLSSLYLDITDPVKLG